MRRGREGEVLFLGQRGEIKLLQGRIVGRRGGGRKLEDQIHIHRGIAFLGPYSGLVVGGLLLIR